MIKESKIKWLNIITFLFSFLLILSFKTVFVNAEIQPVVQDYKMISQDSYINWSTEQKGIGIIVQFDSSITIESTTSTYVELNLSMEGDNSNLPVKGANVASITLNDGKTYTPSPNELLFQYNYIQGAHFLDGNLHLQPGDNNNEPFLLKVENMVIDGQNISVNLQPQEGYHVYYDTVNPRFVNGLITSNEESYQYHEAITIDIHCDEPVDIKDINNAVKLCIKYPDNSEFVDSFTSLSGNGTKDISLSYVLDEQLRTNYEGNIGVLIDKTYVTDIAGNELWPEGYFEMGSVKIQSIYPTVTQADPPSYDTTITIKFTDDDTDYSLDHLTGEWEVGIFLADNHVEDIGYIDYRIYPLRYTNIEGNDKSHLVFNDYANEYYLYIDMTDEAFVKANEKDQEWYFYYYIKDADGNKVYKEISNVYIDRKPPEITIDGEYLTPLTNQAINFEITDSFINTFRFDIKNLNGDSIFNDDGYNREFYFEGFLQEDYEFPDYLNIEDTELSRTITGKIDVDKMVKYINEHTNNPETYTDISLGTDTYKLVIQSVDDSHPNMVSEKDVLFTIDKTPPNIDISTNEGEQGTVLSYELALSDNEGHYNPDLGQINKKPITLFYEFARSGLSSYPEPEENEQSVTGSSIEIAIPYGELSVGTYCLNAKAVDYAGNNTTTVSALTFEVKEGPAGTIDCDDFSNNATLSAVYSVSSTYDNLEYRVNIDEADTANWNTDWQTLNHTNGNGTLSIDLNNYAPLEQGEHKLYVQYRYKLNNVYFESAVISDSFIYDIEGPTAVIQYSTKEATDEPVTAVLVDWADNFTKEKEKFKVRLDGIENSDGTKEVTLNTADEKITFVLADEAGNESKFTAHAPWIIGEAKPATIIYSTTDKTREDVTVYLDFEGMNNTAAAITLLNPLNVTESVDEQGNKLFIFSANGIYNFEYIDDNGKIGYVTAYINNIDRTAPTGEISYNINKLTNNNIYGYIKPSETVSYKIFNENDQLIKEGKISEGEMIKHLFTDNGSVTVLLEDEAGNNSQRYILSVDWIDKTPPVITVIYSNNYYENKTRENVTATITANEPINILNNYQKDTKVFTENEEYTFMAEDKAGNRVDVNISITNIDKSEPIFNIDYSTLEPTNGEVTATLTCNLPITILNNDGSNKMLFTENGRKYFKVKYGDEDPIYKFAEVANIDKQPPVMKFYKSEYLFTEVGGSIDLDEGFSIYDEVDGTITKYTIDDNINLQKKGTYYADYTFHDEAGNKVTVRRIVEVVNDLTLVINGLEGTNDLLNINGLSIHVDVYNSSGDYQLQYKEGNLNTGNFKKNKQMVEEDSIKANNSGYITFYLQDQERNWKLVRCYVIK